MAIAKNGDTVAYIDPSAVQALGLSGGMINEAVRRAAEIAKERARDNIAIAGRNRTGEMSNSIITEDATIKPENVVYRVRSRARHSYWQEFGRGPVQGNPILRFKPKNSSKFIFRPRVGPASGIEFMGKALKSLRPGDYANGS